MPWGGRPTVTSRHATRARSPPATSATRSAATRGGIRTGTGSASPHAPTIPSYDLDELARRIDWTPFFRVWDLRGTYPAILSDPDAGAEATSLHEDALALLRRFRRERLVAARGIVGLYPASTDGDDIVLYTDESRSERVAVFPCIRQQFRKPGGRPNISLADFVAPACSGVLDYVGAFVVTAGEGVGAELCASFEAAGDDYQSILAKALADRLAEAFAERLHERVRNEFWGYATGESLTNSQLIAEEYNGIRPAPGYPASPDHSEKRTLFRLLDAERIGVSLTESCAMLPAASVSGTLHRAPAQLLLWSGPDRPRPAGGLRRAQGDDGGGRQSGGCRPNLAEDDQCLTCAPSSPTAASTWSTAPWARCSTNGASS